MSRARSVTYLNFEELRNLSTPRLQAYRKRLRRNGIKTEVILRWGRTFKRQQKVKWSHYIKELENLLCERLTGKPTPKPTREERAQTLRQSLIAAKNERAKRNMILPDYEQGSGEISEAGRT